MADQKISSLSSASLPLAGTEVLPIVQSGSTVKVSFNNALASPSPIGNTTANTGGFTSLAYTTTLTGGTGIVNIGSGQFYKDASGNIGVGISSPVSFGAGYTTIHTRGTSGSGIKFGTSTQGSFIYSDNNDLNMFTEGAIPMRFFTNSVLALRIGTDQIVSMPVYGAGAATFSAAGVISSVSDETWKTKDGIPTDPDAMLNKLEPGYWYYNDEKKETFGKDRQLGFYAQNVNAAIGPEAAPEPETFTTKNEDGTETITTKPWGYYDRSVLAVTVMSLQKALTKIELLTNRISKLEQNFP